MSKSAILLLALFALAEPDIRYARYERSVQLPAQSAGQACLAIDPAIFAHAAPSLADLRLDSTGSTASETPYFIRASQVVEAGKQQATLLNPGLRDGKTVFDAAMPEGTYAGVELDIGAADFLATATVSGSNTEGDAKATRLGAFTLFDLTAQRLGRSTVLHLPNSDFRYLHFIIDGPILPPAVHGLTVLREPKTTARYLTVAATSAVAKKGRSSIVEFSVPARTPVDRIVFSPGASPANFSRDVQVSVVESAQPHPTDDSTPPSPASVTASLLRVHRIQDGHRIDEEHLEAEAPAVSLDTPSKWTIAIDNGDDAPIELTLVSLQMLERDMCFDAAASATYALFYGDPALGAPQYDYARMFSAQPAPLHATLSAEQLNPAWIPRPDDRPFTEKHPALLWGALVSIIAILGFIAVRTVARNKPAAP